MEAFTDGVLGSALLHLWPSYLAYVTSFITIGIIWMNHHTCVETIVKVDRTFMFLNLLLLTFAVAAFYLPSAALFKR